MTTVNMQSASRIAVGQEFSLKVGIDNITNFDAANYDIDFDPTALNVVAVNSGLIGATLIPVDMWRDFGNGKLRIINNLPGLPGVSGTGYLADIIFKLTAFKSSLSLTYSNGVLGDNQANQIPATWQGKDITPFVVGDVDGDGLVNANDITAVERIILELSTNIPSADVKQDGVVNCLDITAIKMLI